MRETYHELFHPWMLIRHYIDIYIVKYHLLLSEKSVSQSVTQFVIIIIIVDVAKNFRSTASH